MRWDMQSHQYSALYIVDTIYFLIGSPLFFLECILNYRPCFSVFKRELTHVSKRWKFVCLHKMNFQTSPVVHESRNLPEFFHWRLLFLSSGQMTRIIDWEKHNVPVCWKPSHEKWAVEVLICDFYNLCGSNPRRWHRQDDQESPHSLENHRRAGQTAGLDPVLLAAALRTRLCPIVPWNQEG